MKRLFDGLLAALLLLLLLPAVAVLSFLLLLTSGRPILFSHQRVGMSGITFGVLKFRTMTQNSKSERNITSASDPRITPVGAILRRTKLDEIPQLLNVLRGEMSFVGPRPEVAEYVEAFPTEYEQLLTVRPGITDPASLHYRNEQEMLANSSCPDTLYLETILPEKLALSQAYVASRTFVGDLKLILATVRSLTERTL